MQKLSGLRNSHQYGSRKYNRMWIPLLGSTVLFIVIWHFLKQINKTYYILSLTKRVRTQDGSPLESKVVVIPGKTRFGNNFDLLKLTPGKK